MKTLFSIKYNVRRLFRDEAVMVDKQERNPLFRKRVGDWLKETGSLRDGFLVMAGIFYFFGYIVWAINAYRNNLGLLPALEFQYFTAGVIPVLIILGLYFTVIGIKLLRKGVSAWLGPNVTGWKLYVCWCMLGLGIIAWLLVMEDPEWVKTAFPNLDGRLPVIISILIIMVSYLFLGPLKNALEKDTTTKHESKPGDLRKLVSDLVSVPIRFLGWLGWLYTFMFLIALPVIAFIVFVVDLYPKIPQEFGGARPYYACLDVVKAQISNETIEGILPSDANKSKESVVRSLRVEVLFSGSDVILVRSKGRVYKITKSIIQAVTICDKSENKSPGSQR